MSWNLHAQYSCIELAEMKSREDLEKLMNTLALQIWEQYNNDNCLPEHFDCDDMPADKEGAVRFIGMNLTQYIREFELIEDTASFIVYSEPGSPECGDAQLSEKISNFILLNSNLHYIITQSAAFDRQGGYSHQWITFQDGDQTQCIRTHLFVDTMLKQNNYVLPLI